MYSIAPRPYNTSLCCVLHVHLHDVDRITELVPGSLILNLRSARAGWSCVDSERRQPLTTFRAVVFDEIKLNTILETIAGIAQIPYITVTVQLGQAVIRLTISVDFQPYRVGLPL